MVGYFGLMFVDDEAHLTTVAVTPEHQHRGLGTALLAAAAGIARDHGARHLTLEVAGNERAQALYRRFGFAPVGVRKGYYQLTGEDACGHVGPRHRLARARRPAGRHRSRSVRSGAREPTGHFVLGIETSCDETAAALVTAGRTVRSSVVSSQVDLHARYGGVVPELAGRAHVELFTQVVADALGPGRAGRGRRRGGGGRRHLRARVSSAPCWSGSSGAKAPAMSASDVPFVGVNHLEGHLFASLLEAPELGWPLVVLLVSGGHTVLVEMAGPGRYRLLGQTIDDAAGEAYDKVARYLGLGYPGGPEIDAR